MTPLEALRESDRPKAPHLPQATDAHRTEGRKLAMIHRHYLSDLSRLQAVLDRIEAGDAPPDHLTEIVLALDMAQNYRAFGSLCGQGCQMLAMHHAIEESSMFPEIEGQAQDGIRAVVTKLRAEHSVVHACIQALEQAAANLSADPSDTNFVRASTAFRDLRAVVASHFRYEETELEEAIGLYVRHL